MPVTININNTITLRDLLKCKLEGYMVEATPHVGNFGMRTLAAAWLRFAIKLIDINKGEADHLFYPHCLIRDGKKVQIGLDQILTTHNVVDKTGMPIAEFHTANIAKRFNSIFTQSDWMNQHSQLIKNVFEIATRHTNGAIWYRYVDAEGVTHLKHHNSSELPDKIHRVTTDSNTEGWISANPVNLLCDMISGALESGKDTVYMISGSAMYKYTHQQYRSLGRMDLLISELYDAVRASNLFDLPEHLNVVMVQLTCLTHFAVPMRLAKELDRKLAYYHRLTSANKRLGSKKALHGRVKARLNLQRAKVFQCLNKPLQAVCAEPDTANFYTQHDLLQEEDMNIYIPEWVMDTPLESLLGQVVKMKGLLKR